MISLNGRDLTIEQVIRVTRGYEEVKIAEEAKAPMDKARAYVEEKVASGAAIYGLTLANFRISISPSTIPQRCKGTL